MGWLSLNRFSASKWRWPGRKRTAPYCMAEWASGLGTDRQRLPAPWSVTQPDTVSPDGSVHHPPWNSLATLKGTHIWSSLHVQLSSHRKYRGPKKVLNNTTGMKSAKARPQKALPDKQTGYFNKQIARRKERLRERWEGRIYWWKRNFKRHSNQSQLWTLFGSNQNCRNKLWPLWDDCEFNHWLDISWY